MPEELAIVADKYAFNFGEKSLQKDVIELKKKIRLSCNKQMRIKQGYVQMQVHCYLKNLRKLITRMQEISRNINR